MSELQIDMESGDGLERRLRVQVPAARIEDEVELRLRNVARTAKIKGFRPGKVPVTVIRQHYGDEVRREVLQEVLQSSYSEAVSQQNLRPAGGPRIEPDSLEAGHDLTYTAVFEVYPEVQLQGLDDIQVTRPVVSITDADIDAMIEKLRAQRADWNPVERPAREGDRVRVDFTAVLNNEPLPGGSGEDVSIVLGEQQMLPEFEASLTGLSAGDEKTFDLTFPDDYHEQSLAGQTATFTVQLREVAERVLPEIDDSFLRAYGITSGELEDLRADIRVHMQREVETRQRSELRQQVMEGLLAANELDVPGVLVDEEAEALQQEAMRQAGITDAAKAPPVDTFRDA
ncbi:MAG TPA: trigger factor, partial [Chromatiales bacterium]|nr:trigger factor [Chromatiales bacterium]